MFLAVLWYQTEILELFSLRPVYKLSKEFTLWFWPHAVDHETPQTVMPWSFGEHDVSCIPPFCLLLLPWCTTSCICLSCLVIGGCPGISTLLWVCACTVCVCNLGSTHMSTCRCFILMAAVWEEVNDKVYCCLLNGFAPSPQLTDFWDLEKERRCWPQSYSCGLLRACAGWLMAPLKRCSCQSSTFIRPLYLVIVIPQCEKKVGRWVQVGADVSERSQLTGAL